MERYLEHERQGEQLLVALRAKTRSLAGLIGRIPDPIALYRAQRSAVAIGYMMMDLAIVDPVKFFVIWPTLEKEIGEAKAAIDLMRLRLRQPMVRRMMEAAQHN